MLVVGICFTLLVAVLLKRSSRRLFSSTVVVEKTVGSDELSSVPSAPAPTRYVAPHARVPRKASAPVQRPPRKPEDRYGMQVAGLQLIAQGALLRFRYRIVDPLKAGQVGLEGGMAYLIDPLGRRISPRTVPATGSAFAARHLNEAGSVHSTFFPNQGGLKSGDLVTVVMGQFRAENVRVQ